MFTRPNKVINFTYKKEFFILSDNFAFSQNSVKRKVS